MFEYGLVDYFGLTWVDVAGVLTVGAWCVAVVLTLVMVVMPGRPPLRSRVNDKGVREHGIAGWFLIIGAILSAFPTLWLLYLLRDVMAGWLTASLPMLLIVGVLAVTGWIILRWYIHRPPTPPVHTPPPLPPHNPVPSISRETYSPVPSYYSKPQ